MAKGTPPEGSSRNERDDVEAKPYGDGLPSTDPRQSAAATDQHPYAGDPMAPKKGGPGVKEQNSDPIPDRIWDRIIGDTDPRRSLIQVRRPPVSLDDTGRRALAATTDATAKRFEDRVPKDRSVEEAVRDLVLEKGIAGTLSTVTRDLERGALNELDRLLLSERRILSTLLYVVLSNEQVAKTDARAIQESIELELDTVRRLFYESALDVVSSERGFQLDELRRKLVVASALRDRPSLSRLGDTLEARVGDARRDDVYPAAVEWYLSEAGEIKPENVTPTLRRGMVRYLRELNLQVEWPKLESGGLDEYLALAYHHARKDPEGDEDPVAQKYRIGSDSSWDFVVDTLESTDEQPAVEKNIRAAGALYYIFELGDNLGLYAIVDQLVLQWGLGNLDIPQGETASRLYRYFRLRDERHSLEERAMLYRRVFNIGDAETMAGMVVNESFPLLWNQLMQESVEYIRRMEEHGPEHRVSTQPLHRVIRELRYNLTAHMTGMAHLATTEMYAHLKDALAVLGSEEVLDQLAGGYRRSVWTVVENVIRMHGGNGHGNGRGGSGSGSHAMPNISGIRTAAVKGYEILAWIADASEGKVQSRAGDLAELCEAYILAKAENPLEVNDPFAGERDPVGARAGNGDDADWNA